MKGNMVRNAIKMATKSTLNQIKAKRIKDITGVDRIITSIGFMKASNDLFIPAKIPSDTARMNEMVNPINPLKTVAPITFIKFFETKSLNVAIKVDSGDGKIRSES